LNGEDRAPEVVPFRTVVISADGGAAVTPGQKGRRGAISTGQTPFWRTTPMRLRKTDLQAAVDPFTCLSEARLAVAGLRDWYGQRAASHRGTLAGRAASTKA